MIYIIDCMAYDPYDYLELENYAFKNKEDAKKYILKVMDKYTSNMGPERKYKCVEKTLGNNIDGLTDAVNLYRIDKDGHEHGIFRVYIREYKIIKNYVE